MVFQLAVSFVEHSRIPKITDRLQTYLPHQPMAAFSIELTHMLSDPQQYKTSSKQGTDGWAGAHLRKKWDT